MRILPTPTSINALVLLFSVGWVMSPNAQAALEKSDKRANYNATNNSPGQHDVDVSFDPRARLAKINVRTCYNGSGAKTKVRKLTPFIVTAHLQNQYNDLTGRLAKTFKLSDSQVERQLLVLGIKAQSAQYTHQFDQIGNETCTHATTVINDVGKPLSDMALTNVIPFKAKSTLYYYGTQAQAQGRIKQFILEKEYSYSEDLAEQASKTIYASGKHQYIVFDSAHYKELLEQIKKSVHLRVTSSESRDALVYQQVLSGYLTQYGFAIESTPQNAYWLLDFNVSSSQSSNGQTFISLQVNAAPKEQSNQSLLFKNEPSAIAVNGNDKASISKAVEVHLELMRLAQKLSSTP